MEKVAKPIQEKTLKVRPGADKMRVSFKGYKGELGKASQEQLRKYLDLNRGKSKFIVES